MKANSPLPTESGERPSKAPSTGLCRSTTARRSIAGRAVCAHRAAGTSKPATDSTFPVLALIVLDIRQNPQYWFLSAPRAILES